MTRADELYEAPLRDLIREAFSCLESDIALHLPWLGGPLGEWMKLFRTGSHGAQETFQNPGSYPMLLIPWYAARSLEKELDAGFQADLIYSTITGYYFIRLLDNVMDGDAGMEVKLLPAAGFLHSRFHGVYHKHFPPDHPFWTSFDTLWSESVDATARDAFLAQVELGDFLAISGRKFAAGKIPVAALCHRYGRLDLMEPWFCFLDRLSYWSQMLNDLFDWEKDEKHGNRTFLLTEADHRRQPGELVAEWLAREGFAWALAKLAGWMSEMRSAATHLRCRELMGYLDCREKVLADRADRAERGLAFLARLLAVARIGAGDGALHGARAL